MLRLSSSLSAVVALLALAGCSSSSSPAEPTDTGTISVVEGGTDTGTDTGTPDVPNCTSLRETALGPIATVSTGKVETVSDTGGVKTLYIDAVAGGFGKEGSNPWVYLDLATGKKVDLDDKAAMTSKTWDLAFKRALVRNNSNDSGPGAGAAGFLDGKLFDAVTAADAKTAKMRIEIWFDDACNPLRDATGQLAVSFFDWYLYDSASSKLQPAKGTWVVQGADGKRLYKLEFVDYYKKPDGTTASGSYTIRYAAL